MSDLFHAEKVQEGLAAIYSPSGEIMYLIEGNDRAILVDTTVGLYGLRAYVEELTDKPVTVLLTHGHIDHAMGAPEFEEVYMNLADQEVYRSMWKVEDRIDYVKGALRGELPAGLSEAGFIPPTEYPFRDLQEGAVFDLGGIHVDVYSFPGHTHGSMIFLLREMRILIVGDACNSFTFLFDNNSLFVEDYQKEVLRVQKMMQGKYDHIFLSHVTMEIGLELFDHIIQVCDDIMKGKTADIPFEFMGTQAFIAKGMKLNADGFFERTDGSYGNIVYSKDRVFRL
ncbi:MAG: MBL fold metallo-hydrolase [Blautia sp.]|nr:MBL fold metallo-hydrolase [Blautia sp.]